MVSSARPISFGSGVLGTCNTISGTTLWESCCCSAYSCTFVESTNTSGRWLRLTATFIASLKRSTVAEIPQTTGTPGTPFAPLMSRWTIVFLAFLSAAVGLPMPRCASSSTRYRVKSGSSMVFWMVSQIVYARRSGRSSSNRAPAFVSTSS